MRTASSSSAQAGDPVREPTRSVKYRLGCCYARHLSLQRIPLLFNSNEGSPREPIHVHVIGQGGEAKFWIAPVVSLATSYGLNAKTLRELEQVVEDNLELIKETWNCYFRT